MSGPQGITENSRSYLKALVRFGSMLVLGLDLASGYPYPSKGTGRMTVPQPTGKTATSYGFPVLYTLFTR